MNKEYQKIFESLGKEVVEEPKEDLKVNDRILIIDSLNTFLRAFTVIQHFNKSLNHVGGLTGYLRSVGYAINLIRPTRVILAFDGKGSSTNKRYLYPEYKANRGIRRVTNWDAFENQEQESEAITNQLVRLIDYLKCLPVDLISIDKIEADDVIGYISQKMNSQITIMSSDRDYLQLVSQNITVYSPTKKIFYTPKKVLDEYGVSSENFLNYKVLTGDAGDNVPGIKGVGPKTISKLYPELADDVKMTLTEVIDKAKEDEGKAFMSIRNFEHQLKINEKLMDLTNPNIPDDSLVEINEMLENPNKTFRSKEFMSLYEEDDLGNSISNLQTWLHNNFYQLSKYK
jgi:5'-3' exonuclease